MLTIQSLLEQLSTSPETIQFAEVISTVDNNYNFTPTQFRNGDTTNTAGSNNGSCKIFAFAKWHTLTPAHTLALFGDYYRIDVLLHPEASDHANIRNFMKYGWQGIEFEGQALSART